MDSECSVMDATSYNSFPNHVNNKVGEMKECKGDKIGTNAMRCCPLYIIHMNSQ